MHALLITAHGSRRQASNREVISLTQRVRQAPGNSFDLVEAAFLELASPSIPEALHACIASGATAITIAPYFLAGGRHVVEDVPALVASVANEFPHIEFTIAPHVGRSEAMPTLLLQTAAG